MNTDTISIEKIFNAGSDRVWKAISDKNEMKIWYFDLPQFKPEVNHEFQFKAGGDSPEKEFLHLCKVTEVIPGKKLQYSWRYDGYEGNSLVTFELIPEGEKTKLRLTHEGVGSFPELADFAKENFEKGWDHIINNSLKNYLENN